jgi:hypothetical protein
VAVRLHQAQRDRTQPQPDLVLLVNPPGQLKAIHAAPGQLHVRDHSPDIKTGSEHLQSFLGRSNRYDPKPPLSSMAAKAKAGQNLILYKQDGRSRVGASR